MPTYSNPDGVHAPFGAYHHISHVPAGAEWLALSGQVGADADGNVPAEFSAQAEQAFRNILTCLEAHGFAATDIVRLTIYILSRSDLGKMRAARDAVLGADLRAPSTLLIISGLVEPEMKIEIEVLAARAPS